MHQPLDSASEELQRHLETEREAFDLKIRAIAIRIRCAWNCLSTVNNWGKHLRDSPEWDTSRASDPDDELEQLMAEIGLARQMKLMDSDYTIGDYVDGLESE